MVEEKKRLRYKIKNKLGDLSVCVRGSADELISNNLRLLLNFLTQFDSTTCIAGYIPMKDEVVWQGAFAESDYKFALPRIIAPDRMDFISATLSEFNSWQDCSSFQRHECRPDLFIVPGRAFTANCQRMGRGRGFYDRYLANESGPFIGVAYQVQVVDWLPLEDHDRSMDAVVTEKTIYFTRKLRKFLLR